MGLRKRQQLDRKSYSLEKGQVRANNAGLGDSVSTFVGEVSAFAEPFDCAVSMHSCGACTDAILDACIVARAAFALVPCCYGQLPKAFGVGTTYIARPLVSTLDSTEAERKERNPFAESNSGWPRSVAIRALF